jgi:hypothetical protein
VCCSDLAPTLSTYDKGRYRTSESLCLASDWPALLRETDFSVLIQGEFCREVYNAKDFTKLVLGMMSAEERPYAEDGLETSRWKGDER